MFLVQGFDKGLGYRKLLISKAVLLSGGGLPRVGAQVPREGTALLDVFCWTMCTRTPNLTRNRHVLFPDMSKLAQKLRTHVTRVAEIRSGKFRTP